MNRLFRYSALAVFVGLGTSAAYADDASTTGGIKIKSSDGNFDASLGGRIHFDALLNMPDNNSHKIGSGAADDANSDFEFRRVFISLAGHLYGYEYHVDYDLAASNFQDLWIAHSLLPGGTIYAGQHKPWRSMDEIASNNSTVFLERNIVSATGVYGGVDYTNGLYYSWNKSTFTANDNLWAGISVYSLHKQTGGAENRTQGLGYNGRLAYAPFVSPTAWAHVGVNFSNDNSDVNSTVTSTAAPYAGFGPSYTYGGRSGAKLTLASYGSGNAKALGNPHQDAIGGELAGAWGPVYGQAEYTMLGIHQEGLAETNINAYSITGAYAITGETRTYDKKNATYNALRPSHAYGAFEVAARFDHAQNNFTNGNVGCSAAVPSGVTLSNVTKCDVSMVTAGINYYPNPAVRFVLDYTHGHANLGNAGKDSPDSFGLRAQLVF
ncbi:MAG: hypothetical protein JWR07_273 [Nevskia sp.]|nr:hypothetical protein [Nevskia sp.]